MSRDYIYIEVNDESHRNDHPTGRFKMFVSALNWKRAKRQYPKHHAGTRLFELCWVDNEWLEIVSEVE